MSNIKKNENQTNKSSEEKEGKNKIEICYCNNYGHDPEVCRVSRNSAGIIPKKIYSKSKLCYCYNAGHDPEICWAFQTTNPDPNSKSLYFKSLAELKQNNQ